MFLKSLVLLLPVIHSTVFAAPTTGGVPVLKHAGKVQENSYIIKLKQTTSKSIHLEGLPTSGLSLSYTYDQVFHGYAALLDANALEYIRHSSDVEAIFEDGIIAADVTPSKIDSQGFSAPLNDNSAGIKRADPTAVDVYDIGTGIYTAHTSFGGRAHWGATFGGYNSADGNGYDTCLAGIAVGNTYGVATQANIYAVKAMSDAGAAAVSDLIAAINWVISAATASGRPSVTMLGAVGSASTALDAAVVSATNKGVHFIVPAPTSSVGGTSPARVASAVTVGIEGQAYVAGIDICSRGTAVSCPSIQGPTASRTFTGTAAAMARVAGIVAAALGTQGSMTPAAMETALKAHATTTTNGCLVINNPW